MRRREYLSSIGKIKKSGSIKHTYATTFLLPTIGYCIEEFRGKLINVHIDSDLSVPTLILIIDYNPNVTDYLNRLQSNPIYKEYELTETEAIIKFKIPYKYHDIFFKFIAGKYSEFDTEYKQILTNIYGMKVNPTGRLVTEYDTIYPRREKIKQVSQELNVDLKLIKEVFDIPDLGYEIYTPLQNTIETTNTEQVHE